MTLFGTGKESRDFIHVSDLIKVIDLVIGKGKFNNDCINVANGKELYIKTIAETFYDVLDPSVSIQFQGQVRKGDPINWVADVSKIQELGYVNSVNLKSGITKYVAWLKENA